MLRPLLLATAAVTVLGLTACDRGGGDADVVVENTPGGGTPANPATVAEAEGAARHHGGRVRDPRGAERPL